MKKTFLYIASMMLAAAGFTACDEEFERPPMIEPVATIQANTTIADLKAMVWKTDKNYVETIGQRMGEDIIIAGRVVSNDSTGNIYKSIIIQDNTGALTVSVNAYDLYQSYQFGQQVVVNVTGLKIGGYNSLLQLGGEGVYNGAPSMTFMEKTVFEAHAQVNGLARPSAIDTLTVTIPEITEAKNSVEGLQKLQSRLVRIDGVKFKDAGQTFAGASATDRAIVDAQGNSVIVRNSAYAKWAKALLPATEGSIVGILSYYGTNWQILLNDLSGCIGFGDITIPEDPGTPDTPDTPGTPDTPSTPGVEQGDGSAEKPYNAAQVIAGATGTGVWVKGYIVGSATGMDLTSAVFAASPASQTNVLLATTPGETNIANCIPVQLSTSVRGTLNLADNPGNYKGLVSIKGDLVKYFGANGVKNTTEASKVEGGVTPPPVDPSTMSKFKAVSTITSGKSYVMVAGGKMAKPLTGNYGYFSAADATVNADGTVSALPANAFTITAVQGGFNIQQADARFVIMTGTYNSFNLDAAAVDGSLWTVTFNADGAAVITNVAMNKSVQYDAQYTSYGAYPDVRGTYPTLYEKVD